MTHKVIFAVVGSVFVSCLWLKFGLWGCAAGLGLVSAYLLVHEDLPPCVARVVALAAVAATFGMSLWLAIGEAAAAEPALATVPPTSLTAAVQSIVDMIVLGLVGAFIAWLKIKLSAWFGVELDARHRETLQSALTTAANIVVASGARNMAAGFDHLRLGAGDAIRHFGLPGSTLEKLLEAKVESVSPQPRTE